LETMGLEVLKTPACVPQANSFCERLIGTIRRECLDFVIPRTERHLRAMLREWITHYNRGRPHSSLGPGFPDPPPDRRVASNGHQLPTGYRVVATPILAGLHHDYRLEAAVRLAVLNICGGHPMARAGRSLTPSYRFPTCRGSPFGRTGRSENG